MRLHFGQVLVLLRQSVLPRRLKQLAAGRLVAYCIENGKVLEELELSVFKQFSSLFEQDVYTAINLTTCVEKRTSAGGTSIASVEKQIALVTEYLNS